MHPCPIPRCAGGRRLACAWLIALLAGLGASAHAQAPAETYPNRPIRLIVPFPAGGGGDTLARLVMTQVAKELGQPLVVENLAGAGGNVGSQAATRAQPDGYTLLYATNGTAAINPALYKTGSFDALRDMDPVARLTSIAAVVVVKPEQAGTLQELLAQARARPDRISFASAGNGTTSHLAGELLNMAARVSMQHVPYRGGAAAITDLIGGQVQVMVEVLPNAAPQIRAGRLRALAVTTSNRQAALPDVPTVAESGLPGFDVSAWDAILVPKGTPAAIVARIEAAVQKTLASPDMRRQLSERGSEPAPLGPGELTRYIQSEMQRWGAAVKRSGASVD